MEEEEKKSKGRLVRIFLLLLFIVLVILFSIDNGNSVELGLIFTQANLPLTAIILGNFLLGLVFGLIMLVSSSLKHRREMKTKDNEIEALEDRLANVNAKIEELSESAQ